MTKHVSIYENGLIVEERLVEDDEVLVVCGGRMQVTDQVHHKNGTVQMTMKPVGK